MLTLFIFFKRNIFRLRCLFGLLRGSGIYKEITVSSHRKKRRHLPVFNVQLTVRDPKHRRAGIHADAVYAVLKLFSGEAAFAILLKSRRCFIVSVRSFGFFNGLSAVFCIDRPHILKLPEPPDNAFGLIARRLKHGFPGVIFVPCHIVIGVISGNYHKRLQNSLFIAALFYKLYHILKRRRRFHRTYIIVVIARRLYHILHFGVDTVRRCFRTVSHKADGGFSVVIFRRCFGDGCYDLIIVFIRVKKGFRYHDAVKGIRIIINLIHQIVILVSMHEMSGLNHKISDSVVHRPVKSL